MSLPFLSGAAQPSAVGTVNAAHQQLSTKLSAINTLRAQKAASKLPEEQAALQTLIDLRSTEAQPLLTAYVNAVNTFIGS
jgi:hypothetical protein